MKPSTAKPTAEKPAPEERSVLSLLREIQSGATHPSSLSPADRQAVVEHLTSEGYSISETAEILKTSERTVARDRSTIRARNSVARDPKMVEQVVGHLLYEAQNCITRMRRAARDKEATPAVRVDAEHRVYQILSDLTTRLQGLGYLPSSSHTIKAEVSHQLVESSDPAELQAEIIRLLQIGSGTDGSVVSAEPNSPLSGLEQILRVLPGAAPPQPRLAETEP